MKRLTSAFLLAMIVAPAGALAQAQRANRPNIVFIMTDDHAAHAIGAYGSRVNQTPNLDRLASEGALLTSVFATNSVCTPSRAAILTGQYSHINGVTMFNRFASSRMTVARLLQQGDQWELFDLVNDSHELHNLYGERGQDALTSTSKAELARLKREVRDDDQLAGEQLPNGVDGPVARLRGR